MSEKLKKTLSFFLENATTHGISGIYQIKNIFVKILVLLLFLTLVSFMGFSLIATFRAFFKYEVYTSVEIETNHRLQFPAVTICSNNAIPKSYLNSSLLQEVLNKTNDVVTGKIPFDEINEFLLNLTYELIAKLESSEITAPKQPPMIVETLNDACLFAQKQRCNLTKDFKPTFPTEILNTCYTFNSGLENRYIQSGKGSGFGLSLVMFMNQSDFLPLIGKKRDSGITVYIHDSDTLPMLGIRGMLVGPGFHTKIAIRKTEIVAKPTPFPSNCSNGEGIVNYIPGAYTSLACQLSCVFDSVLSECGYAQNLIRSHVSATKIIQSNASMLQCRDRVMNAVLGAQTFPCQCPRACNEIHYESTMSHSRWPNDIDLPIFKVLSQKIVGVDPSSITDDFFTKNFLKLDIYFDDMSVRKYIEKEMMGRISLFSNIGGHLGFWTGSSLFSIFEWFVALVSLLMLFIQIMANKFLGERDQSVTKVESIDINPR